MKITLSKAQWNHIGRTAGWMSNEYENIDDIVDQATKNPTILKRVLNDNPEICNELENLLRGQSAGSEKQDVLEDLENDNKGI